MRPLLLLGLITAVLGSLVQHEKRGNTQSLWVKRGRALVESNIQVRIALKQRNIHLGHDALMDVSDPASTNFGRHWTAKQVEDLFSPSNNSVKTVRTWLVDSGIVSTRHRVAQGRGSVHFTASVEELEKLLHTEYHVFEHASTGANSLSCDGYFVPSAVREHLDFVTPSVGFHKMQNHIVRAKSAQKSRRPLSRRLVRPLIQAPSDGNSTSDCSLGVNPECIKELYQIPDSEPQPGNELGIINEGIPYAQPDLELFFSKYTTIPRGTAPTNITLDGGLAFSNYSDEETTLDLDVSYPVVYPQGVKLFNFPEQAEFDHFLDAIDGSYCNYEGGDNPTWDYPFPGGSECGVTNITNVVSASYSDDEFVFSEFYIRRQCNEYMKLGLQGVTFLMNSGDGGAGCGLNEALGAPGQYASTFPGDCPYVLSVGATQLLPGPLTPHSEVAVIAAPSTFDWSSSGGFSNAYTRPAYQASAVTTYITNYSYYKNNNTRFNITGRAWPDVSAVGQNLSIVYAGQDTLEGGTSASTPLWASIITLINQRRLAAGKSTVGFVNPVLYAHPEAFNDVIQGFNTQYLNSTGCNGTAPAFNATPGWDPATGLGSPNVPVLIDIFMSLP